MTLELLTVSTDPTSTPQLDPYVEPAELTSEVQAQPLPLEVEELSTEVSQGVRTTELLLISEILDGQRLAMHAWLSRPAYLGAEGPEATRLAPVMLIPGGHGVTPAEEVVHVVRECEVVALGVDWISAGLSPRIEGLTPWPNQFRFEGESYRSSYQFHNVNALMRATNFLLEQPFTDPGELMAMGGSWGGFYTWLLAGLDPRFTYIFPTFGCGFLEAECHQVWESDMVSMGDERREEWLQAFDPARRVHLIEASVFYQTATNDKFYSLLPAMHTYRRVRTEKRLLLARNQDHFMDPHSDQDVAMLRTILAGTVSADLPEVEGLSWLPGTNRVEVRVELPRPASVSVVWSSGEYTPAFARHWRSVEAENEDGRWFADIPVVDVDRELWLYAHVIQQEPPFALSSEPIAIVPREQGLLEPTAEFDPSYEIEDDTVWTLPAGDHAQPAMRIVKERGKRALAMRFDAFEGAPRRGVLYCLEGDLIARHGLNAIEVTVKVPDPAHVDGLMLALVTDFQALAEQDYCIPLAEIGADLDRWQTLRVPFSAFQPYGARHYWFYDPPLGGLEVERLCGVGFYHPDPEEYSGEVWIRSVRAIHDPAAPPLTDPPREPLPWPARVLTLDGT
jgi:prolyl oligopeptidase family protein